MSENIQEKLGRVEKGIIHFKITATIHTVTSLDADFKAVTIITDNKEIHYANCLGYLHLKTTLYL